MQDQITQIVEQLKEAKNVLVTVSRDPSVDQLAAAIGLTLTLNKLDKHATAVYSGQTPSTIEFLRPEETFEKTTDSLRDFIIALDKSKADKLRYKVEDDLVRIFITPYHTAITESDLNFTQGDFNVDVVLAIGVREQRDLDEAIVANGRILHDATVVSISTDGPSDIGTMNIVDTSASSLSELAFSVIEELDVQLFDEQISTALLTGIVATTERFSNGRTTPKAMSASATLMANGANQQLIANELEAAAQRFSEQDDAGAESDKTDPSELSVLHDNEEDTVETPEDNDIHVDDEGKIHSKYGYEEPEEPAESSPFITQADQPLPDVPPADSDAAVASADAINRERVDSQPYFENPLSASTNVENYDPETETTKESDQPAPVLSRGRRVLQPISNVEGQAGPAAEPGAAPDTPPAVQPEPLMSLPPLQPPQPPQNESPAPQMPEPPAVPETPPLAPPEAPVVNDQALPPPPPEEAPVAPIPEVPFAPPPPPAPTPPSPQAEIASSAPFAPPPPPPMPTPQSPTVEITPPVITISPTGELKQGSPSAFPGMKPQDNSLQPAPPPVPPPMIPQA